MLSYRYEYCKNSSAKSQHKFVFYFVPKNTQIPIFDSIIVNFCPTHNNNLTKLSAAQIKLIIEKIIQRRSVAATLDANEMGSLSLNNGCRAQPLGGESLTCRDTLGTRLMIVPFEILYVD